MKPLEAAEGGASCETESTLKHEFMCPITHEAGLFRLQMSDLEAFQAVGR